MPATPSAVGGWLLRAAAELWRLEASGTISGEYAARLRNGLSSIARFLPAAGRGTGSSSSGAGAFDDDDDEPGPAGPQVELGDRADQSIAVD